MFLRPIMIAALLSGSALPIAEAATLNKFDGRWTIVLSTDVETCEATIPATFNVKADDIAAEADSPLRADGAVEASGSMWIRFTAGQDNYRGQGKLTPSGGSGVWSSGSRYCGGKWKATRTR